jgi:hypothetical protein
MRKTAVRVLTIASVAGLCSAFGFEGRDEPQGRVYRVGYPDAWVDWESTPNGQTYGVNVLRQSFGILVVSVFALYYAVRRRQTMPGRPACGGRCWLAACSCWEGSCRGRAGFSPNFVFEEAEPVPSSKGVRVQTYQG